MDRIVVGDRVSWKRTYDDQRTFGHVEGVRAGFYEVKSDAGVWFALRTVTREET